MPTFPGFHPNFELMQYPPSTRSILRRLADHFYVTRSFEVINIGGSSYYAALLRPTDETSVYLNTQREIVALFSHYETFEIRTLEAFDEIYSLVESKRVDDSIRFLISDDQKIENHIRQYLRHNPEYPIIIPIFGEALVNSSGNQLVEAIQSNYVIRDLFGYQAPLRQEYFFFGRSDTVNSVLDLSKSGQNSSLFGLRKSGKTSTIFAMERKAKATGTDVVVVDCQNPAVHGRRFDQLLWHLVNQIKKSVGQKLIKMSEKEGLGLVQTAEQVQVALSSCLSSTKGNILVVFDEIENISPGTAASDHWRNGSDPVYFWQILRSFYQEYSKGRLSFCLVGTSPRLLEIPKIVDIDNPVYLFSQKRFIPNLSFKDTEELVRKLGFFMGLRFSNPAIAKIHQLYAGHPFFTRQLCSAVHRSVGVERPIDVSTVALERAEATFMGQMENYLIEILSGLKKDYEEEFRILASAIKGNRQEFDEYVREAPELLDHLIGYGLIIKIGNDYELAFDALKGALVRAFPELYEEDESAWKELSERRNNIEQNIRRTMFFESKRFSSAKWNDIVEGSLTKKRLSDLKSYNPTVLFSNAASPLYLSDLLMLLKHNEIRPLLGEDCSRIIGDISALNSLRKDAHANSPQQDEMKDFRLVCDRLETDFFVP